MRIKSLLITILIALLLAACSESDNSPGTTAVTADEIWDTKVLYTMMNGNISFRDGIK